MQSRARVSLSPMFSRATRLLFWYVVPLSETLTPAPEERKSYRCGLTNSAYITLLQLVTNEKLYQNMNIGQTAPSSLCIVSYPDPLSHAKKKTGLVF